MAPFKYSYRCLLLMCTTVSIVLYCFMTVRVTRYDLVSTASSQITSFKVSSEAKGQRQTINISRSLEEFKELYGSYSAANSSCTLCPIDPPGLIGPLAGITENKTMVELEQSFLDMESGGHLMPDCQARQKLAIIIPYRNREPHLLTLLENLIPFLTRQQADATFFVIEQTLPGKFNRGILQNIGFLESQKKGPFDCYIFHDVDLIPLNDKHMYRCGEQPRHFAVNVNTHNYRLLYKEYFGGVVAFTHKQYLDINGNSNLFFGWGGEDDDLYERTRNAGYDIVRAAKALTRYKMMSHTRDIGNEENPLRKTLLKSTKVRQYLEGLNTCRYKVANVKTSNLFTKISVILNETEILQTAPSDVLQLFTGHPPLATTDDSQSNTGRHQQANEDANVQANIAGNSLKNTANNSTTNAAGNSTTNAAGNSTTNATGNSTTNTVTSSQVNAGQSSQAKSANNSQHSGISQVQPAPQTK